jgi:hypothetical protein
MDAYAILGIELSRDERLQRFQAEVREISAELLERRRTLEPAKWAGCLPSAFFAVQIHNMRRGRYGARVQVTRARLTLAHHVLVSKLIGTDHALNTFEGKARLAILNLQDICDS